jgi:serine/threonine-protein kinase
VVHRDVSPSNVLLARTRQGEVVKVLDFGVARLQQGDEGLTDIGVKLGTAEYMAPEYVEEGILDVRSDLYGLGVLAYALLTGGPPFVGPTMKVMQDHVNTQPPPPSVRAPGLPPWLEVLTMVLLAKDPAARPPDAQTVVDEIERNLSGLEQQVRQERQILDSLPPQPMQVRAASVGHHTEPGAEPAYPAARSPRVPLLILAALALSAACAAGLVAVLTTVLLELAARS